MKLTRATKNRIAGMLIVNADDLGRNELETRTILSCHQNGRITSASAMMFMKDSVRAAELALSAGLDVGLHLNFTEPFEPNYSSMRLNEHHQRVMNFLSRGRYTALLYNPMLKNDFEYIYKSQYEEYIHLYGKNPTHIDGHHHKHLCMNMLVSSVLPKGLKVRRNFSFLPGEKHFFNRLYRQAVDTWLTRRYICVDFFFSIIPIHSPGRLQRIMALTTSAQVELMVHPANPEEYDYLMSDAYLQLISGVRSGSYAWL
jgi:predicted glycoside hydrolase/deacetylase ChbG (UPF0249 family)